MIPASTVRSRLEVQGFRNLDDATLAEVGPWLRWSPSICAVLMATGTILASPLLLWSLAAFAALGAVLPFHPFDLAYNHLVRRVTRTRPLPHHGPQRRFACGLATAWLTATGAAFYAGATSAGYVLGGLLTAAATLVATTHICIPSLVYNALFERHPRATPAAARSVRL